MIFKDAGVCATPEIVHWDSVSPDALLVICSDGVWEFLSSEDVCDFLQEAVQTSGPEVRGLKKQVSIHLMHIILFFFGYVC